MKKRKKRSGPRPATPSARDQRRKPSYSRHLSVLLEDESIIAINKPPGMPAVPIKGSTTISAFTLVKGKLRAKRQEAFVVHRIDRFTSGIILFAKTERGRDNLVKQFLAHKPEREYLAVVRGHPKKDEATLVHHFKRVDQRQILSTAGDRQATLARLSYKVLQKLPEASVLRVFLDTGLQNQIRAQFQAEGNPLVGDSKYEATESSEQRINRVALHATGLSFKHPVTGTPVSIRSDMPKDISGLIRDLRKSRRD